MHAGLLLLRLILGLTMAAHGSQKLFGSFGGGGIQGTKGFMVSLGYRLPLAMAALAACSEFFGGLAFAAGLATPLAALALVVVMCNAVLTVHLKNGFFNGGGGYEFNLLIATIAVAVAAIGPGRYSLDHALHWDDNISGFRWGVGVALAGLAISLVTLVALRSRPAGESAA